MDRPLKETVYTPDSELLHFGALLKSMGSDLLAARELAWRLRRKCWAWNVPCLAFLI